MRAVTIDSDLATLFTFTPRKPAITPIQRRYSFFLLGRGPGTPVHPCATIRCH